MRWGLVKPWVNRVGIVLEFLSFWLAAPEILGEERLRALEHRTERRLQRMVVPVLAWMLLVILGFAAYYQVSHAVVTSSQEAATSVWDHLIFSLGAFTTLQPARLQAARPVVELLTTIQAIIGISLAGLLGFVAGNRIRRS